MRNLGRAALIAAALLWLISACGEAAPDPELRVVLITLDTLRYDRFAGPTAVMPRLAASAQEGAVFSRCYSATSSTQPSHASMFTGAHPWQHGVSRNGLVLPEAALTVPQLFSFAGFSTAAAVSSFPMENRFGFARGFDHYRDEFALGRPQKKTWGGHDPDWNHFYSAANTVTDEALALIDQSTGSKQFFFFHYFDAHSPYGDSAAPAEVVEARELTAVAKQNNSELPAALARAEAAYDRDVEFLDQRIDQLLQRLAQDAEHIETHIIITADHGESFGDDGSFGHGDRITEAQLHVPLIILSPQVGPGVRSDPAGSIDVARTLLAMGGLDPHLVTGGRNLCPEPTGRTPRLVGMRRTYGEPARDVRTSGEVVELTGLRFYQLRDNGLIVGDSESLEGPDDILVGSENAALRDLFGDFEQTLLSSDAEEQLDAQTRAALDALGYTR